MSIKVVLAAMMLAAALVSAQAEPAAARERLHVVGSSTVFPFTTAVAEKLVARGAVKPPVVESTGTGGGMRLFCAGVGSRYPDLTAASRRMTRSEFEACSRNGVGEIVEIPIGFDGIVVAHSVNGPDMSLTLAQLWLALARTVPVDGELVANPFGTWSAIDPSLPAIPIQVLGPPPTSGTRDSFEELALDVGCREHVEVRQLAEPRRTEVCRSLRQDGMFVEVGENDALIVQTLQASPGSFGVFGFGFSMQNAHALKGVPLDGVEPTAATIRSGRYPLARTMYLYAKIAHVEIIQGMREFLAEYTSEAAVGDDGYLSALGLVPLPAEMREVVARQAAGLTPMTM